MGMRMARVNRVDFHLSTYLHDDMIITRSFHLIFGDRRGAFIRIRPKFYTLPWCFVAVSCCNLFDTLFIAMEISRIFTIVDVSYSVFGGCNCFLPPGLRRMRGFISTWLHALLEAFVA